MPNELIQKKFGELRHMRLHSDCIEVKIESLLIDIHYSIRYEQLHPETIIIHKNDMYSWVSFVPIICLLSMAVGKKMMENSPSSVFIKVFLFLLIVIGLLATLWGSLASRRKVIRIGKEEAQNIIAILAEYPNKALVDDFVAELQNRIRERLIHLRIMQYEGIDTPDRQIYALRELLREEVITEEIYQEMIKKYI